MTLREITEADYPAIQALHRSVGWPERSQAGWRWLHANPARLDIGAPAGWVADGPDGQPAAHVGNLIQRFRLGDRRLHGATGFNIIVTPTVRGISRQMLQTFTRQPGVFARYTLNANSKSQPLYARHGMQAWPERTHALKLSWVVAPLPLAISRVWRRLYALAPDRFDGLGEQLMNDRLGREARPDLPRDVHRLTDFGDVSPYAAFWAALVAEGRLLADRSPAVQRWRLQDPDLTQPPLILSVMRDGAMVAYAMAMMAKSNILEPPVLEILDLESLADHADAVPVLMTALTTAARAMGAAKLRLQAVTPRTLDRLGAFAGSARQEGGWGHCHVEFAPGSPDPALWSPTPYDGDYAVCLRPVPLAAPLTAQRRNRQAPARSARTASKA
ncbi:N-acetyltransferase [Brevundimonas sp. FT23028]|uniref:N-acetyltransferase n=1 Tax=Brevundimonas sp. FT23028 TaxID=3393748 RepID=UPI003B5868A6